MIDRYRMSDSDYEAMYNVTKTYALYEVYYDAKTTGGVTDSQFLGYRVKMEINVGPPKSRTGFSTSPVTSEIGYILSPVFYQSVNETSQKLVSTVVDSPPLGNRKSNRIGGPLPMNEGFEFWKTHMGRDIKQFGNDVDDFFTIKEPDKFWRFFDNKSTEIIRDGILDYFNPFNTGPLPIVVPDDDFFPKVHPDDQQTGMNGSLKKR
jgi:hypothetical protein